MTPSPVNGHVLGARATVAPYLMMNFFRANVGVCRIAPGRMASPWFAGRPSWVACAYLRTLTSVESEEAAWSAPPVKLTRSVPDTVGALVARTWRLGAHAVPAYQALRFYLEGETPAAAPVAADTTTAPTGRPNAISKPTAEPAEELTVSQENAVDKAADYLSYSSFSRSGLIKQLKFEGFTTEQATYGVGKVGL